MNTVIYSWGNPFREFVVAIFGLDGSGEDGNDGIGVIDASWNEVDRASSNPAMAGVLVIVACVDLDLTASRLMSPQTFVHVPQLFP